MMGYLKNLLALFVCTVLIACAERPPTDPTRILPAEEATAAKDLTSDMLEPPMLEVSRTTLVSATESPRPRRTPTFSPGPPVLTEDFPDQLTLHDELETPCSPLAQIAPLELVEIISNPFVAPLTGRDDGHPGIDMAFYRWHSYSSIDGHPVQSVFGGRVAGLGTIRLPYGNYVIIETPFERIQPEIQISAEMEPGLSIYHLYAHLQNPVQMAIDDAIACGQKVGHVGTSGSSVVPHLHLEARLGPQNMVFTQMAFYDTRASLDEMAVYELWRLQGAFRPIDPLTIFYPPPISGPKEEAQEGQ